MIRQKIKIEIDWDIQKKDKATFRLVKEALLNECLKTFTGIYQAKVADEDEVLLTVFKPSATMVKNIERMRAMKKKMVAMKKKK